VNELWRATPGFYTVWLTYLGRRFGLLQSLARGSETPSGLARRLHLHPPAVDAWCSAAQAAGLLHRRGASYALSRTLVALLASEDSREYLAGQFEYVAAMSLDYERFDDLFRHGRTVPAMQRRRGAEAIAAATNWDHTAFLDIALPRWPHLRRHLERGVHVLDLGCGAGAWMVRTARRFPRSRFVGIDPDRTALTQVRRAVKERDLEDRVTVRVGDAGVLDQAGAFDLAYLGEALSAMKEPARVLSAVRRALKPGAHLVLLEGILPERPDARPDAASAFVLGMHLDQLLQGSGFFTKRDLLSTLEKARFRPKPPMHLGGGLWAVAADRPSRARPS